MNEKKLKIIKTAMKLFVSQGFEHTPTAQISKEANVATGTLFYHYKTKEDLINEIYLYVKKSMKASIFENVKLEDDTRNENISGQSETSSDSFQKIMKNIWKNMLTWGFKNKCENQFLVKFHGSVYISNLTMEELQDEFKQAEELFKKGYFENQFKDISLQVLQSITMSLLQSFLTEFYRIGKLDKNLLEKSFEVYWDAIKS